MSKWQYRLRYTNLNWSDGGSEWKDVTPTTSKAIDLSCSAHLIFRRKPTWLRRQLAPWTLKDLWHK